MTTPALCARGCGFYGNPRSCNLCSKCYVAFLKEDQEFLLSQKLSYLTIKNDTFDTSPRGNDTSVAKTQRCKSCKKNVKLTGFSCKCGELFCGVHRYPEVHACPIDYKSIGRAALAKENPLCKADKLQTRI